MIVTFDCSPSLPDCYVVRRVATSGNLGCVKGFGFEPQDKMTTVLIQSEIDVVCLACDFGYPIHKSQDIDIVRRWLDAQCGMLFIYDPGYFEKGKK